MSEVLELAANLDQIELQTGAQPTDVRCHIRVRPSAALREANATPVGTSICLAIDCSASMFGDRIEAAIASAKQIVDALEGHHAISVVAFQSRAQVLLENAACTLQHKGELKEKIDRIRLVVGGSTNLAEGIKLGVETLKGGSADAKVMVVLSDGAANSPEEAEKEAISAADTGVQIFAVGAGDQYEAEQLLDVVRPSSGAVFGENDLAKLQNVFAHLLGRINSFVATGARITVMFPDDAPQVTGSKISPEQIAMGTLHPDVHGEISIAVGNIERDAVYSFLLEFPVAATGTGDLEVARVRLIYDVPSLGHLAQEQEICLRARCAAQPKQAQIGGDMLAAIRRANLAKLIGGLVSAYNSGDLLRAESELETLGRIYRKIGDQTMQERCDEQLSDLRTRKRISKDKVNQWLISSPVRAEVESLPAAEPETTPRPIAAPNPDALYDLILLDAGDAPIRVVREIRDATGLSLREASVLVRQQSAAVSQRLQRTDADELRERLQRAGATAELRPTVQTPGSSS